MAVCTCTDHNDLLGWELTAACQHDQSPPQHKDKGSSLSACAWTAKFSMHLLCHASNTDHEQCTFQPVFLESNQVHSARMHLLGICTAGHGTHWCHSMDRNQKASPTLPCRCQTKINKGNIRQASVVADAHVLHQALLRPAGRNRSCQLIVIRPEKLHVHAAAVTIHLSIHQVCRVLLLVCSPSCNNARHHQVSH